MRTQIEQRTPARRRRGAIAPAAASRLAIPRSGAALWGVRLVALGLVAILLVAIAQLLSGIL
jgi:hypothetical protein